MPACAFAEELIFRDPVVVAGVTQRAHGYYKWVKIQRLASRIGNKYREFEVSPYIQV